jgi:hypothetical protein
MPWQQMLLKMIFDKNRKWPLQLSHSVGSNLFGTWYPHKHRCNIHWKTVSGAQQQKEDIRHSTCVVDLPSISQFIFPSNS